jgi:hypothetical protein
MNRIQKYQDSIDKFFKTKLYQTYFNKEEFENILKYIKKNNFLLTIFLLTLSNNINKKNKIQQHGYYIGTSLELVLLIIRDIEKENLFKIKKKESNKIINLINIMLVNNLEQSASILTKDKLLKNYNTTIKNINIKMACVLDNDNNFDINKESFNNTDMCNYKFKNDTYIKKIYSSSKINKEDLNKYIENKYCEITEIASQFMWLLGGGNENQIIYIQKLGRYYGFLIKIFYDLNELEEDINNDNKINNYYPNIIINLGIQESFEYFFHYKKKFIELSIKLGVYSNIIKELLDYIEEYIDKFLDNTNKFLDNKDI